MATMLPVTEFVQAIPLRTEPHVHVYVPPGSTHVRISTPVDLYLRTGVEPAEVPMGPVSNGLAAARLQANGEHVRCVEDGQVLTFVARCDDAGQLATLEFFTL